MASAKRIGVLTAGGDSPGLNAAIRGLGKAAIGTHGMELIGFRDGIRGLSEDRHIDLDTSMLSGILTTGGTILGTSRDKAHKMLVDGEVRDMTGEIAKIVDKNKLDGLVLLGGGGTAKNALRLANAGVNVMHLPKTIDKDVAHTDNTFGFSTALEIATDAIDRLHSTAHSHHRIIIAEIMGHKAGWLTLGSGIAGGADVILLPEIPFSVDSIVTAIQARRKRGTNFSVVAVAEGARDTEDTVELQAAVKLVKDANTPEAKAAAKKHLASVEYEHREHTFKLAHQLEEATGLETRVTILGYVQRGGIPCAEDRLLGSRIGSAAADLIADGEWGIMVGSKGEGTEPVPLKDVAGNLSLVPLEHSWIRTARNVGTSLGD
ncbi:ATP-dependent 6-phosphofructokinase [Tessaracoccus sp. OS52]|uniref:6-phosphofructokinase n=1 Tax=Tessaracoccus sp. OS52 TaxID=2886691 RepID=UPI001D12A404|nr:ATP-dependent 6-phosphofructokinase [Tessaracoccus sp. OS52]MCC2593697.1 ATP-dependent 6-phosphofructokinase [Tessaracoccus sp. OS52]